MPTPPEDDQARPLEAEVDETPVEPSTAGRWGRAVAWASALRPAWKGLAALLLFAAVSFLFYGLPIAGELTSRYAGLGGSDSKLYQWSLGWTPWAIAHDVSPLVTDRVFAPGTVNLAWVTFLPGPAILLWPVTKTFGALASYNLLMIASPALASWGAYLVCHRLTRRFWASIAGGALFGFSAYMAGQMVGHVNLVLVFPIPLLVYLVIRRVEGSLGWIVFTLGFAALLVVLFSISTELFATTMVFGGVAFLGGLAFGRSIRLQVLVTGGLVLVAGGIAALVLLPYLQQAFANAPETSVRPLENASVDLLSFVVPRRQMLFGGERYRTITESFTALGIEDGAYLGPAVLAMLVGFAITGWRRRSTWLLLGFVALVGLFALGPVLHVSGEPGMSLPGSVLASAPLLEHATPQRFPLYGALAVAVIGALWLADAHGGWAWVRWVVVGAAIVSLAPAVASPPFHPEWSVPAFFTSGTAQEVLRQDEIVYAIPRTQGEEVLWQQTADYWFRLAQGYVGPIPSEHQSGPLSKGLTLRQKNPYMPTPALFAEWMTDQEVSAIVLDDAGRWKFEPLLRSVGMEPVHEGEGVSVWRAPNGFVPVDDAQVTYGIDGPTDTLLGFSVPRLRGEGRIDYDAYRGEPLVLSFIPAGCDGCPEHVAALGTLAEAHPDLGVVAIVSFEDPTGPIDAPPGVALGVDPIGRVATLLGATDLPYTVVLGPTGQILGSRAGTLGPAALDALLARLATG